MFSGIYRTLVNNATVELFKTLLLSSRVLLLRKPSQYRVNLIPNIPQNLHILNVKTMATADMLHTSKLLNIPSHLLQQQ